MEALAITTSSAAAHYMPSTIRDYIFGSMFTSQVPIHPALLPVTCCLSAAAVFRWAALEEAHCRDPFVRKVYHCCAIPHDAGQESLARAREGRYDGVCSIVHKGMTCRESFWYGLPRIARRALIEVTVFYAALAARARFFRGGRDMPRLWDYGVSLAFYLSAFSAVRALSCGASNLSLAFPRALCRKEIVSTALPLWLSLGMYCVKLESIKRQR
eukprot:g81.t1